MVEFAWSLAPSPAKTPNPSEDKVAKDGSSRDQGEVPAAAVLLLDAARFMDYNECQTVIPASRSSAGKSKKELLRKLADVGLRFGKNAKKKLGSRGKW